MPTRFIALFLFTLAGVAYAKSVCGDWFDAYNPSYLGSTEDGEDSLIDTTPSTIQATATGDVLFSYTGGATVRFRPAGAE